MNHVIQRCVTAAVCLAACAGGKAQTLSPPEASMVASVDGEAAAGQELLRQLVEINSGTMNLEGVRAVRALLEPRFQALGFRTRVENMDAVHRAETLVAEHPCPKAGACGKRMLLIGHMDTVFDKGSPFQHWKVDGDTATGPGTSDMKGGLVVMLMALDAMQTAGVLRNADVTAVLTGDEESHGEPSSVSRNPLVDAAKRSDVALEFEGVPRLNGVYYGSVSRRGALSWSVKATGKSGHSSGVFNQTMGFGAIYELARILDGFRSQLQEPNLTFNVGMVAGGARVEEGAEPGSFTVGGKTNIIPALAEARGDLRALSEEQAERVKAKMRDIVAQHLPGTTAEIAFQEGYPAMAPTEASRGILKTLNQVNAALGVAEMPELNPMDRGAGDISFVAPFVPGLAGVGATGTGAHAPGETVDLPSQVLNAKRDALLMYRLSQQK